MNEEDRPLSVRVDHDKCVGSTMCIQTAPAAFELDGNRQSVSRGPDADTPKRIRMAAEACPVSAIVIEDARTGERIFP